jgi:hypothetical protein
VPCADMRRPQSRCENFIAFDWWRCSLLVVPGY